MKYYVSDIDVAQLYHDYSVAPPEDAIVNIRERTLAKIKYKSKTHSITFYAVIVTVTFIVILLSSAFVFHKELQQIVFGNSIARLIEFKDEYLHKSINTDGSTDYSTQVSEGGIINRCVRSVVDEGVALKYTEFTTFEELQQVALFEVKELSGLPPGSILEAARIKLHADGTVSHDVYLEYSYGVNQMPILFAQLYAGPDAYIVAPVLRNVSLEDYQYTSSIEQIMIEDIEALLTVSEHHFYQQSVFYQLTIHLTWIKNEIAYELITFYYPPANTEANVEPLINMLLAIAESV